MTGPAAVIGSGPNGLAAAVTLARAGVPVTVFEAAETAGGGMRTSELVAPGVLHDVCSAIHPLALATGFFGEFALARRVDFVVPEASYAHPLDGRRAAVAYRDLGRTAAELGPDGRAYARLLRPILRRIDGAVDFAFGGSMLRLPRDPVAAATVALRALEQGSPAWNARFGDGDGAALLTGAFAHGIGAMPSPSTAAVGLLLGALAHASGWPVPVGGSQAISDALTADLRAHGGRLETGHAVDDARELDAFAVKIFDTSARDLAGIAGDLLPRRYRRALSRFRPGNGVAKVDLVLDGPVPWRDPRVAAAPTVHLGGSRGEIAAAEREVARGRHPDRPFVLLAQPTDFDPGRNPAGVHAIWSYTHVPAGSDTDVSERVIAQIERFAPGVRDLVRAVRTTTAEALAGYNRNYIGGDIAGGAVTLRQLLARPALSREPWRTPARGVYLASSSTAPGPGVHGLAGWYAARAALRHDYRLPAPRLGLDGGVPGGDAGQ
ncbi:NAD(P)/FAD-dependent oxidoreductase [Leucobacter weissii]|uniref:Pyridine nucleotide-disulfide oxidoreductase domain-containing protein 2 n=1 Tax=Leucobacter weissii TaxID=1983706 RepID=A0A939MGI3_9MICO|nr:NAD(P)/FAD-dependent oxidoreductase [Leucobacter weissii]MBO1900464.1 NAD(P)/FAD-dependent oxidoreductase [Leucobacter weissii]